MKGKVVEAAYWAANAAVAGLFAASVTLKASLPAAAACIFLAAILAAVFVRQLWSNLGVTQSFRYRALLSATFWLPIFILISVPSAEHHPLVVFGLSGVSLISFLGLIPLSLFPTSAG